MSESVTKLADLTVCVTRPEPEAVTLAESIIKLQGQAIIMPVMTIVGLDSTATRIKELFKSAPDMVIFMSRNAVRIFAQHITSQIKQNLLYSQVAVIGASTANLLLENDIHADISPQDNSYTSEALLASPELQNISGFRIIVVRGEGGRAKLADELGKRGANVSYCEVYKRQLPESFDQNYLSNLDKSTHILLCTSTEIMHNLLQLAGAEYETIVKNTPLLVVSSRIEKEAVRLGFQSDILVSENATDQAVIKRLIQWHVAKEK